MFRDKFDFNFWPSFTDLMLSFVLVVLIILFVVSKMIATGSENLDKARESQKAITEQVYRQISSRYTVKVVSDREDSGNNINANANWREADITIIDKLDRQTITFSDKVLFDTDESELKSEGKEILTMVGPVVKNNLSNISEIQIQGHADIKGDDDHNLILASQRAMAVYKFLQDGVGIDPGRYLMSSTSFGKYKPVGREAGDAYSPSKLAEDNDTEVKMARNRRIEIVLFYKNDVGKK